MGAGGNSLNFQGRGTFEIHLVHLRLEKKLSVAEISDEVLLGADILQHDEDGPVDLILSQNLMICRGISIPVQQVGMRQQIRHARLADHYIIPGMSQMNVDVFIDPKGEDCTTQDLVLVEPKPELAEEHSVVMGRTLLDMSSYATGKVLVMNPFDWPVSLKQDTVVGYVEEIEDPPTTLSPGMEDHTGPGVPQGTAVSLTDRMAAAASTGHCAAISAQSEEDPAGLGITQGIAFPARDCERLITSSNTCSDLINPTVIASQGVNQGMSEINDECVRVVAPTESELSTDDSVKLGERENGPSNGIQTDELESDSSVSERDIQERE